MLQALENPSIYRRAPATNIKLVQEDSIKVQQCNPTQKPPLALHGESLRQPMLPLNSNDTKSAGQGVQQNCSIHKMSDSMADAEIFPLWEENYQDLSSFCMDGYQGVFLTDELQSGHSGMKIRDTTEYMSSMDIVGEELINDPVIIMEKDSSNQQINNNQIMPPIGDKQLVIGGAIDVPDEWLNQPKSSIALRTDEWIQHIDKESVIDPLQGNVDDPLQSTCNPTLNLAAVAFKKEPWDEALTFDQTPTDSFDLLSYLCNDEAVAVDNPLIATKPFLQKTLDNFSDAIVEVKSEPTQFCTENEHMEIDETPLALRQPYGKRTRKMAKSTSDRLSGDLDSDSDESSMRSYKGAREKNNEASRKSRMNKKQKETEIMMIATQLERDNVKLRLKADHLEKMVLSMRAVILQYALSKNAQYNNNS